MWRYPFPRTTVLRFCYVVWEWAVIFVAGLSSSSALQREASSDEGRERGGREDKEFYLTLWPGQVDNNARKMAEMSYTRAIIRLNSTVWLHTCEYEGTRVCARVNENIKVNMYVRYCAWRSTKADLRWDGGAAIAHPPRPVHPSQQQAASEPMDWLTHCRAAVSRSRCRTWRWTLRSRPTRQTVCFWSSACSAEAVDA